MTTLCMYRYRRSINLKQLNLINEVDRRKIYEAWRVPYMDANQLAAAGFYFTNQSDIVRCVFCGVEIGFGRRETLP